MNIGRESEYLEFKKTTSELKAGLISIVSILNRHGRGTLYFGVNDSGDVCGQDIGKDTLRTVSRDISGLIHPVCWYEVNLKTDGEGNTFIEINFSGDQIPYSVYGRYYQRFSDEDRILSSSELEKLFRSRRKDYSAWEKASSDVSIDRADLNLLRKKIKAGNASGRIIRKYDNAESILSKLGLMKKGTRMLTNAGNVLFSKDGPVLLKLASYATDTKDTFLQLNHFQGNVYACIEEALRFIYHSISWNVSFTGRAARKETPEIPGEALREIVVNAFAHGQYDGSTAFEIDVFKDRVSIYSPGLFPAGYSPEDFAFHAEEPVMLNPKIVSVLFKTGEIESFGSGFRRTFDLCRQSAVEYRYTDTRAGFRFEFSRPLCPDVRHRKSSETQESVLKEIQENKNVTAREISKKIGKSEKTVYRAIRSLKEENFIIREGDDCNGSWIINH